MTITRRIMMASSGFEEFDPFTSLTNIIHGWRADLGLTLTGSAVDQWDDQVGSWDLLDAGTKPTRIVSDLNGQDVISFPGDGGRLKSAGSTTVSLPFLICMVFEQTAWTSVEYFWADANNEPALQQRGSSPGVQQFNGFLANLNSDFSLNTYFLARLYHSNTTSDYILANDGSKVTGENAGSRTILEPWVIGANFAGASTRAAVFKLAEFLILSADLTGTEESLYLNYISSRYGIS